MPNEPQTWNAPLQPVTLIKLIVRADIVSPITVNIAYIENAFVL